VSKADTETSAEHELVMAETVWRHEMECWAVCIPSSGSGEMLSVKFLVWKVKAKLHRVVQWRVEMWRRTLCLYETSRVVSR